VKEAYITKNLAPVTLGRIEQANQIIEEYQAQGFTLTVRQIYYQFVARDLIPNELRFYRLVANALEKGRLTGQIDWQAIEDRTRFLRSNTHWEDPEHILMSAAAGYKLDTREDQDFLIEVWIEKDALVGVIDSVCKELDIDFFSCRGYVSLSEMWRAAQRYQQEDRTCVLLHLGDHDPSGLDMTRDITDRLENMFQCDNVEVRRIALNMDQIKKYNPPPNFAKTTDTRSGNYIPKYGNKSWELDALSPNVIVDLIRKNVENLTDEDKRQHILSRQEEDREMLNNVADKWDELKDGDWI